MAYLASHFMDSPIFIYDEMNNLITKTTVTGYDRDEMYIEVPKGTADIKLKARLHLLIIHSTGVSELSGFLRSMRQGIYEISFYGEQQREGRTSNRRTIDAFAVISDMQTDSSTAGLQEPIHILIQNISGTGVLVRIENKRLEIGTILQIELNIGGKEVILFAEVIRERDIDGNTIQYGCQLHFLD